MRFTILLLTLSVPAWALSPEFIGKWFTQSIPFMELTIEESVSEGVDAAMDIDTRGSGDALLACKEQLETGKLPLLHCESLVSEPKFAIDVELQSLTQGVLRTVTASGTVPTPDKPAPISKRVTAQLPASSHTG